MTLPKESSSSSTGTSLLRSACVHLQVPTHLQPNINALLLAFAALPQALQFYLVALAPDQSVPESLHL